SSWRGRAEGPDRYVEVPRRRGRVRRSRLGGCWGDSAAHWEAGGPRGRARVLIGAAVEDPTITGLAEVATFAGFVRRAAVPEALPDASDDERPQSPGGSSCA